MHYSDVLVGLRGYYSQSYQRWYSDRSYPPPCTVIRDSSGQMTILHAPGYTLSDRATHSKRCESLASFETAFIIRQFDERGAFQYDVECGQTTGLCTGRAFFEDWFLSFEPPPDPQIKFPDIYRSVIGLFERSVVARSYPRPGGDR